MSKAKYDIRILRRISYPFDKSLVRSLSRTRERHFDLFNFYLAVATPPKKILEEMRRLDFYLGILVLVAWYSDFLPKSDYNLYAGSIKRKLTLILNCESSFRHDPRGFFKSAFELFASSKSRSQFLEIALNFSIKHGNEKLFALSRTYLTNDDTVRFGVRVDDATYYSEDFRLTFSKLNLTSFKSMIYKVTIGAYVVFDCKTYPDYMLFKRIGTLLDVGT